jgi:hypothetical protein
MEEVMHHADATNSKLTHQVHQVHHKPRTAAMMRQAVARGRIALALPSQLSDEVLYTQQCLVRSMLRQLIVCAQGGYAHIKNCGEAAMRQIAFCLPEAGDSDAFCSIYASSNSHHDPEALLRVACFFVSLIPNTPIDLMDASRKAFADER